VDAALEGNVRGGNERHLSKYDQLGFSLLEVLLALFIAMVGLLSLSSMQASAIKGNGASIQRTRAVYLTQSMLEKIADGDVASTRVFGYMDMATAVPSAPLESGSMTGINCYGDVGGPFDLQWNVFHNTTWSRRIDVTVTWIGAIGHTRNVNLVTSTRGVVSR